MCIVHSTLRDATTPYTERCTTDTPLVPIAKQLSIEKLKLKVTKQQSYRATECIARQPNDQR